MEHLEIEFKMLLKENIFKKLLSDYKNQIKDSYQQTNFYLFHPLLEKKKYSLRIREKKGHYELTLKRPSTIGLNELNIDINKEIKDAIFNHQHINNEIFDILEKENIYIKDLTCGYYLKTTRHDIILPDGVLSLDENEYNHHHDYEIEFEVEDYDQGLQTFKKIIQPYHLEYKQNCLSKIKRMLETLKNEQPQLPHVLPDERDAEPRLARFLRRLPEHFLRQVNAHHLIAQLLQGQCQAARAARALAHLRIARDAVSRHHPGIHIRPCAIMHVVHQRVVNFRKSCIHSFSCLIICFFRASYRRFCPLPSRTDPPSRRRGVFLSVRGLPPSRTCGGACRASAKVFAFSALLSHINNLQCCRGFASAEATRGLSVRPLDPFGFPFIAGCYSV